MSVMKNECCMEIDSKYYAYKSKSFAQRLFGHIGTVCKHKHHVRVACFKMGRYRQGIFHDMSKFSLTEFVPSVKYYSGTFSPNNVDRVLNGCSSSWLHHKGRNRHHFEYWIDFTPQKEPYVMGCRMPLKYVAEMVADRYAACVAYNGKNYSKGDAWEYYARGKGNHIIHPDTIAVLEKALAVMRDDGEDAAFAYMKSILKITKGSDYSAESLGLPLRQE